MRSHTLAFEFEVPDDDAEDGLRVLQVEAKVRVSPYDPGNICGPADSWYPPEGGEVEIDSVKIDGKEWKEADWPHDLVEAIESRAVEAEEKMAEDDRRFGYE